MARFSTPRSRSVQPRASSEHWSRWIRFGNGAVRVGGAMEASCRGTWSRVAWKERYMPAINRIHRTAALSGPRRSAPPAVWHATAPAPRLAHGPAALLPTDVLALQRLVGNQAVQRQLQRSAPQRPMSPLLQRMTIFIIGSEHEKPDFAMTHDAVAAFRAEQPIDWQSASFENLGSSEELTIWAHMDGYQIGGVVAKALASHLLEHGFTTCKAIRLLGCNQTKHPATIISIFRMALAEAYATRYPGKTL